MIVVVTPNKNGKIELTKEQLQEYLEQAKAEGAKEERERNSNRLIVNPCVPLTYPNNTGNPPINWDKFTCGTVNPEQEIIATSQQFGTGSKVK